jgi:hypothetical protein
VDAKASSALRKLLWVHCGSSPKQVTYGAVAHPTGLGLVNPTIWDGQPAADSSLSYPVAVPTGENIRIVEGAINAATTVGTGTVELQRGLNFITYDHHLRPSVFAANAWVCANSWLKASRVLNLDFLGVGPSRHQLLKHVVGRGPGDSAGSLEPLPKLWFNSY